MNEDQQNAALGKDLAESFRQYQAQQTPSDALTPDKQSYFVNLADASGERRDAGTAKRDPLRAAVDNYKADLDSHRNLHDAHNADVTLDADAAPADGKDFDEAVLVNELGLDPVGTRQLAFDDHTQVENGVAAAFDHLANTVSDNDLAEWLANDPPPAALELNILKEIEKWASPRYGRVSTGRTEAQAQRTQSLVKAAFKMALASHKRGHRIPKIEVLLRRARFVDDGDYKPAKRGHTPTKARTSTFANIHEAYRMNPT